MFSISISLSDNVPAPCFSEISSEIFRKSKMCYAPHSLRFRSAPSTQGEGYNIAYLFPIIFCNSAINDEISLNERYTEA